MFDDTLRQALIVQLRQSPYLNVVSDDRVRETLRFMKLPNGQRLTMEVAREVCQRQSVKALLHGSIDRLGENYVIGMNAIDCANGETLATEQVQAPRREDVLTELGRGATTLREELGETLATLQKYDVPIERATTRSLDALKAFTSGVLLHSAGDFEKAITHLDRAIALDPEFALAYAQLSTAHNNLRAFDRSREFAVKAYELRERVSERERLYIESRYHDGVTGDIDQSLGVYELWAQTYPRDFVPRNNIGVHRVELGDIERGLESYRQAIQLNPANGLAHGNLAFALYQLNRFDEARPAADDSIKRFPGNALGYQVRALIACLEGDAATVGSLLDAARARRMPDVVQVGVLCALREGRLATARLRAREVLEMAAAQPEMRARHLLEHTFMEWRLGDPARARQAGDEVSRLLQGRPRQYRVAYLHAEMGNWARADALVAALVQNQPNATALSKIFLPVIRASRLLADGRAAEAVDTLKTVTPADRRWPDAALLRAQALLKAGDAIAAAAEFEKVAVQPPPLPATTIQPLAMLGLARARAAAGQIAEAKQAYDDALALWKDADADFALLLAARKERAALK